MNYGEHWTQGQDPTLLRKGLEKLKSAALFQIIATIITGVSVPYLFFSLVTPFGFTHMPSHAALWSVPAVFVLVLAAIIVAVIISLISIYVYLVPSFTTLAEYNRSEFGTASTLVRVGFIWGLVLLLLGIALIIVSIVLMVPLQFFGSIIIIYIGFMSVIVSLILIFIGSIGVIVGMFKLHDLTQDSLFMVAGILFIISIFLGILGFVAWIIVYVACTNNLEKLSGLQSPYSTWGFQGPSS